MKVLVVASHPNLDESNINKKLINLFKTETDYTLSVLDEKYKHRNINVKEEQDLLLSHDIIVFQFPLYWYNVTPLMKEYFDVVYLDGFCFGKGCMLGHKNYFTLVSCGANKDHFTKDDIGFSFQEMFTYIKGMINKSNGKYHGAIGTFDSNNIKDAEILNALNEVKNKIYDIKCKISSN